MSELSIEEAVELQIATVGRLATLELQYERLRQENAILRTHIAGLEDDCNEYAEIVWSEFDTKGGDFVPPYPDNPLTKERKAHGRNLG